MRSKFVLACINVYEDESLMQHLVLMLSITMFAGGMVSFARADVGGDVFDSKAQSTKSARLQYYAQNGFMTWCEGRGSKEEVRDLTAVGGIMYYTGALQILEEFYSVIYASVVLANPVEWLCFHDVVMPLFEDNAFVDLAADFAPVDGPCQTTLVVIVEYATEDMPCTMHYDSSVHGSLEFVPPIVSGDEAISQTWMRMQHDNAIATSVTLVINYMAKEQRSQRTGIVHVVERRRLVADESANAFRLMPDAKSIKFTPVSKSK